MAGLGCPARGSHHHEQGIKRRFKKAARGDAQPDSDYDIAVFLTSTR
jgi:predicted nucleotidyltransferase